MEFNPDASFNPIEYSRYKHTISDSAASKFSPSRLEGELSPDGVVASSTQWPRYGLPVVVPPRNELPADLPLSREAATEPEPEKAILWKKCRFWIAVAFLILASALAGGLVGGLLHTRNTDSEIIDADLCAVNWTVLVAGGALGENRHILFT